MAMRTGCCLNRLPPPISNHSLLNPPKKAQFSWLKTEGSQRSQKQSSIFMVCLACSVIGFEFNANAMDLFLVSNTKDRDAKWSDKRTCPSWRENSLETIVPENLPRPTARRRWEVVGYSKNAPPLTSAVKRQSKCFSM
ncbi:Histone deacetylase-like protein [Quillaja saponaria]|uniref:Histone deacetylase-like protein n=1 Tax=Quillaja saponaria TaxID=32244 RepID=A0AAD7LIL1_QUISA|nr:Histone deacetylase-like protein [Quillaja saponaria]